MEESFQTTKGEAMDDATKAFFGAVGAAIGCLLFAFVVGRVEGKLQ
jgi:hypothetical protein